MWQTNWEFIKYVIFTLQKMTPEQLKKYPIKPIIKVHPTKDEKETTTSTQLSEENSISDTPTQHTEEPKPISGSNCLYHINTLFDVQNPFTRKNILKDK